MRDAPDSKARRREGGRTRGREDAGRRGGRRDGSRRRGGSRRRVRALDELYAATSEATAFATKVSHPRDVRDATTALGGRAVVGDSARQGAHGPAAVGVAPDRHVFNALLRSEACARRGDEADEDEDAASEEEVVGGSGSPASSASDGFGGSSLSHHGVDALPSMTNAHAIERSRRRRAVLRVEALMRDMVESGAEPDLHSFMALLSAYSKTGDVRACSDALVGMRARNIPLDQWAFNALLGACAAAGDVDAATTREGCGAHARRGRRHAAALFDGARGQRGSANTASPRMKSTFDDASGTTGTTGVPGGDLRLLVARRPRGRSPSPKGQPRKGEASDASSSSSGSSSSSSSSSSSRMVPSRGGPVSAFGEAAAARRRRGRVCLPRRR